MRLTFLMLAMLGMSSLAAVEPAPLRVAILDGQNNHNWKATTPILKKHLDEAKRFQVSVITTPERGKKADWESFRPDFSQVDVLISNYNGEPWPKTVNDAFEARVKNGQLGVVIVHAANNAFTSWKEYNQRSAWAGGMQSSASG